MRPLLRRRPFRGRGGQAAVLIALSLFAMLLLLAMSTNVGVVVNDKIRMQTTADAAVYAVAYSEAASLNDLVELNKGILDAVKTCRQVMQTGTGGAMWIDEVPCGCKNKTIAAEIALQVCKVNVDFAIEHFIARAQYFQTVTPAIKAGKATAGANFANVNVSFFQNVPGSPTFRGTYTIVGGLNLGPSFVSASIADFRQVTDTKLNYMVLTTCGSAPACVPTQLLSSTTDIKSWFYKKNRDPDVWVAGRVSGTPEKQYLDIDYHKDYDDRGYFGASSTGGDDKIYAYSVAKPYDGSIGPSELLGYQQDSNMAGVDRVYSARGTTYPKMSMYDEYRARLAGVNENLAGTVSPSDLVRLDGALNGKAWDMSKVKH